MSGHFSFRQYPDVPRTCHDCGKALKVADVAEVREYPEAFFRCAECAFPLPVDIGALQAVAEAARAAVRRQGDEHSLDALEQALALLEQNGP